MGLSPGSLTNQGTGSLVCVNQLTHKVSDTHLPDTEKRVLRAEAALLCPQICGPSRGPAGQRKYIDATLYLLMHHGVFCNQARDLFSAGSVAEHVKPISEDEPYVSRALRDIEHLMVDAATRLEDVLFEEYWGQS